ncbi:AIG2-like family protein [Phlyctema vagabunda]|uniref:Putative gamma-glutamylcyclotransferase n=1 Tax=Phlyctema vagabunda TaxID=108571 RepID=A0ABR4PTC9_9HELO
MDKIASNTAFFYGTLMAPEVLYRVCDSDSQGRRKSQVDRLSVTPALLRDHCRHRVYHCDYPGMIPEQGKTVRGTYVTGLTDLDMMLLDQFEGPQYTRTHVEVELLEHEHSQAGENVGSRRVAQTYVFRDQEDLEKVEWDYEEFRREKLHNWASTSDEYREVDEFNENGHDPTGGRGIKAASTNNSKAASGSVTDEALKSAV